MIDKFKWLLGVCALALLAAGMAPWTFSGSALRLAISQQVTEATGLRGEARGRAIFALLPRPRVKIENFRASDDKGGFSVEADYLRGDIRLLPMFAGRLELANASLEAPRIDIQIDRLDLPGEPAAGKSTNIARQTPKGLGSISLVNGSARVRRATNENEVALDNINMIVDWRGLAAPLTARGTFMWFGDSVEAAVWIGKPLRAAQGESTPIVAKFDAPLLTLSLDGAANFASAAQYDGKLTASTPSINDLARTLLTDAQDLTAFGGASVNASAHFGAQGLTLSDAQIKVAGTSFDGAVTIGMNAERPTLSGTLATERLDLSPFLAVPSNATGDEARQSGESLPVAIIGGADVDLRVSAAQVLVGRLQASDASLSILARRDHAEASLAGASAFRGGIKGRMTIDQQADGYAYRAQGSMAHVDFAALLAAAGEAPRLSGIASGDVSLESGGATIADIIRRLTGTARLELTGGDIAGLDIEQALRRIERRPLSIASELRGGRTAFQRAVLTLSIEGGVAKIQRGEGVAASIAFNATGEANIPTREFNLRLRAWQTGATTAPVKDAAQLAMDVRGPWNAPTFQLDTQSLIQRSRAAAPLWSGGAAVTGATDATAQ